MNNVTITGRDKDDRPTFKANIKQAPGGWVVFTLSSAKPLTPEAQAAMPDTYAALLKLAARYESDHLDTSKLTPADIGRWVEYNDGHGKVERGRIKGWHETVVHVVYNGSAKVPNWQDYTGQATDPSDLRFIDAPTELASAD